MEHGANRTTSGTAASRQSVYLQAFFKRESKTVQGRRHIQAAVLGEGDVDDDVSL
jgi:hypothetical protein